MENLSAVISDYMKLPIAIYGLGNETKKFISEWGNKFSIVGLLDGYLEDGEMFGHQIMSMQEAIARKVVMILVIARPGSCKAIAKRIGSMCSEHSIELLDIRGNNLLAPVQEYCNFAYDFEKSMAAFDDKASGADVVSFDLFDTLVMRKVYDYTDVFVLLDLELKDRGIIIPDFVKLRLHVEKELSRNGAPTLEMIYERLLELVGGSFISAEALVEMEWQLDFKVLVPRYRMCEKYREFLAQGKTVAIVTDTYYSKDRIKKILENFDLLGYAHLLVSCEENKSKTSGLYDVLKSAAEGKGILHIGDDETADILCASQAGLDTFKVYSGSSLFDMIRGISGNMVETISEHIIAGLFVARLFNNPFQFESEQKAFAVERTSDIGYAFFAPVISDFTLWLKDRIELEKYEQILFCSRDGYLIGDLYRRIDDETKSIYFITSRIAAIRAGIETENDISSVESMKFFGDKRKELNVRFGVSETDANLDGRVNIIVDKAKIQRTNYRKYAEKLGLENKKTALFDFVAKGTVQLYLQRILKRRLQGFYFMQLEPDSMEGKGVAVEPFYLEAEKETSAMFDNYYILETIVTSPYPQVLEFDKMGNPVFSNETRKIEDIKIIRDVQEGIKDFFEDYIELLPRNAWTPCKQLDESLLTLINQVEICDKGFMSLKVEDPFFGRMTDISDVIGY